jgi:hypothetical protein
MAIAIRIEIIDQPSRSKGWARYRGAGVSSRTGNPWVSASREGGVYSDGAVVEITTQVRLRKSRGGQHPLSTMTHRLVAAPGQVCMIEHRPGSQGLALKVYGAIDGAAS